MKDLTKKEWTIFLSLFFMAIVANLDKSFVGVAGVKIMEEYGFTPSQFGNITSVYYASNIITTLFSGYIIDKYGYKIFMLPCFLILAISSATYGLSGFLSSATIVMLGLTASRFIVGIGQTGYTNGSAKVIVENFEPKKRQSLQAIVVSTAGIGAICAYTIFTYILNNYGWKTTYFTLSGLFAIAFILMLVVMPNKNTPQPNAKGASLIDSWKHKNTLILGMALFFNNLVGVVSLSWLPSYLKSNEVIKEQMTNNPNILSNILLGYGLCCMISVLISSQLVGKYFKGKEKPLAAVLALIGSVALYMMTTSSNLTVIIAFLYISQFLLMIVFGAIILMPYSELADSTKENPKTVIPLNTISSAYSVINILAFAGAMIGTKVVGVLATKYGFGIGFASLSIPFLLSGLTLYLLPKTKK